MTEEAASKKLRRKRVGVDDVKDASTKSLVADTNGGQVDENDSTEQKSTCGDDCDESCTETSLERRKRWLSILFSIVMWALRLVALGAVCHKAWNIRLHAVNNYGRVIHEFDPWFNYRATEYLEQHGLEKFLKWYDTMSWSPLGRPVGTTIFPGMQMTAVCIYRSAQFLAQYSPVFDVTLNDVCVFMPAGFGCLTSLFTFGLASEASGSPNVGVLAAAIVAVIPAHIMRSVAGGFDNESVAVAALCATFYFWARSLRKDSYPVVFGILTGFSYVYMVAAWGGYVFVLNMVGVHAAALVGLGRHSTRLYKSYSLFYVIGTVGALQIPVVGWNPLQSAEQLGPMAVFIGLQLYQIVALITTRLQLSRATKWLVLYAAFGVLVAVGAYIIHKLIETGYVWEFSVRIKSLFIEHTKTGNPLVDSVAEHQSTPTSTYIQYLHHTFYVGPVGFLLCLFRRTDASYFVVLYCLMSAYFALKMIRLVLLCAPAISAAAAMAIVLPLEWSLRQFVQTKLWSLRGTLWKLMALGVVSLLLAANHVKLPLQKKPYVVKYKGFPLDIPTGTGIPYRVHTGFTWKIPQPNWEKVMNLTKTKPKKLLLSKSRASKFLEHCETLAEHLSEPQIILRGSDHSGNTVLIDDFRESYFWLRDNTPEDARIMAWWDYGYQITGIGNRTSIADGNTWNHEHIALLGRCLVSNEEEGHKLIRHLADYMLIWTTRYAGMYGDDLAKSPHMARIAGSVYSDIKPSKFYIDQMGQPSRMMRESVLFKLHYYKLDPTMKVKQLKHFKEVHTTKNRMVRIYKVLNVSKPSKRHPFGSYPPALKSTLDKAKDFSEVKRLQRLKAKKFD